MAKRPVFCQLHNLTGSPKEIGLIAISTQDIGVKFVSDEDQRIFRRRIEEFLRKKATPFQLLEIAEKLNIL